MLSGPPAASASPTRASATSSADPGAVRTGASPAAGTTACTPSLSSTTRSPAMTRRTSRSGAVGAPGASARLSVARSGCAAASSAVRRPAATSESTCVWSCVSTSILPSRTRYARVSPIWASTSRSPSIAATVSVVPSSPPGRAATSASASCQARSRAPERSSPAASALTRAPETMPRVSWASRASSPKPSATPSMRRPPGRGRSRAASCWAGRVVPMSARAATEAMRGAPVGSMVVMTGAFLVLPRAVRSCRTAPSRLIASARSWRHHERISLAAASEGRSHTIAIRASPMPTPRRAAMRRARGTWSVPYERYPVTGSTARGGSSPDSSYRRSAFVLSPLAVASSPIDRGSCEPRASGDVSCIDLSSCSPVSRARGDPGGPTLGLVLGAGSSGSGERRATGDGKLPRRRRARRGLLGP